MVKTQKIAGGADYAGVADRLKEFRQANPRANISTSYKLLESGGLIFEAHILQDKADESSAESTGSAMYNEKDMQKAKSFEKLETISVGRALALLGYLNNGEVATSEEMVEFEDYRNEKKEEAIGFAIESIISCKTIDELRQAFGSFGSLMSDKNIIEAKDKRKVELNESN